MKGAYKKIHKKIEKEQYWKADKRRRTMEPMQSNDQKAFYYYKNKTKLKDNTITTRGLYSRAVMSIYKAIADLLSEYEGGVQLELYGYFQAMALTNIPASRKSKNTPMSYHTDGYDYTLQFFYDTTEKSVLKGMIMDRMFNRNCRKVFSERVYDSHRPKLYYTMLKSLNEANRTKRQVIPKKQ